MLIADEYCRIKMTGAAQFVGKVCTSCLSLLYSIMSGMQSVIFHEEAPCAQRCIFRVCHMSEEPSRKGCSSLRLFPKLCSACRSSTTRSSTST